MTYCTARDAGCGQLFGDMLLHSFDRETRHPPGRRAAQPGAQGGRRVVSPSLAGIPEAKRLLNIKCSLNLGGERQAATGTSGRTGVDVTSWKVLVTDEVNEWLTTLDREDPQTSVLVIAAINVLRDEGPALGRPLVDTIKGSSIKNLKELRPGSSGSTEVRILFAFDPQRQAVLLVAGDKSEDWKGWYKKALKDAERLYAEHLRKQHDDDRNKGRHEYGTPGLGRGKGRAGRRPRGGDPRR